MPPANPGARDGGRHEHEGKVTAEFQFGILDSLTFVLYEGDQRFGLLMVNATDRSCHFLPDGELPARHAWMTRANIRNWWGWLRKHQVPRGEHEAAF